MKNNKGAITIIVLTTTLFMIAFLVSTYTILANRRQTQAEIKRETKAIYERDIENQDEIYLNYFVEENEEIPIYSVEELLQIASEKDLVIKGKIYNLSKTANYKLMNDIKFKVSDYATEYPEAFEENEEGIMKWIDIETQIENGTLEGNFDKNGNNIEVEEA